jgi:hypothetical protein
VTVHTLVVAERFRGPPHSGNGGYVCGRVAACLPGTVAVRLKAPPPLETELRIEADATQARLLHGAAVVAEARCTQLDLVVPAAPSFVDAEAAARDYAGFRHTPFTTCFVCGPQREEHDGLRIFPGTVAAGSMVAAPWTPDESLADEAGEVRVEFLWSALDCPGAYAVMPVLPAGRAVVLGELCVDVHRTVRPGERCVVIGWPLGVDGRKRYAGTAVVCDDEIVAAGRAAWVEVQAGAFGGS